MTGEQRQCALFLGFFCPVSLLSLFWFSEEVEHIFSAKKKEMSEEATKRSLTSALMVKPKADDRKSSPAPPSTVAPPGKRVIIKSADMKDDMQKEAVDIAIAVPLSLYYQSFCGYIFGFDCLTSFFFSLSLKFRGFGFWSLVFWRYYDYLILNFIFSVLKKLIRHSRSTV